MQWQCLQSIADTRNHTHLSKRGCSPQQTAKHPLLGGTGEEKRKKKGKKEGKDWKDGGGKIQLIVLNPGKHVRFSRLCKIPSWLYLDQIQSIIFSSVSNPINCAKCNLLYVIKNGSVSKISTNLQYITHNLQWISHYLQCINNTQL